MSDISTASTFEIPGALSAPFGGKPVLRYDFNEPDEDPQDLSMAGIIEHLVTYDHAQTRQLLAKLFDLLIKVKETFSTMPLGLIDIEHRLAGVRARLEENMATEENVLFNLILSLEKAEKLTVFHCADITNPITSVTSAQEQIKQQIQEILAISDFLSLDYGECGVCVAIHQALKDLGHELDHQFQTESEVLFPRAIDRERELTQRN